MSDDLVRITVSDGKYTFVQRADGSCYALRYDEPWREEIFDGMALAMAHRIEELEAKLARVVDALAGVGRFVRDLSPFADPSHSPATALARACEVYAELTGENHE